MTAVSRSHQRFCPPRAEPRHTWPGVRRLPLGERHRTRLASNPKRARASVAATLATVAVMLFLAVPLAGQTNTAPRVQTWTTSPETQQGKAIANDFCDDHGLDQYAQRVYWNGADVTSNFPWRTASSVYNCAVHATSQGTYTLTANLGLNTLQARVCDLLNYSYSPNGPLCTTTALQSIRFRNVDVTPDNASANKAPNRIGQYFDFTVARIAGTGSTHFGLTATCSGGVTSCAVPDSVILDAAHAPDGQLPVRVTFNTGALNATGTVTLRATTSGAPESYDQGSVTITNTWPNVLTASTSQTNNDNQALGACAASCFAATAVASTVPYFSMDAARSVTLVYHGDRVAVRPFVYADVSLASGADSLLQLTLSVTKPSGARITFLNNDSVLVFAPGDAMTKQVRLAGQFDAVVNSMDSTGMYPATIVVTAKFADHTESQTIATKFMVVNERASPIARGWTVAGLQRIHMQATTDSSVLITEGDGSAVYFARNGADYTAPPGEFTKLTVSGAGTSRQWVRATPDSTKFVFDSAGRLTNVITRWSDTVSYSYAGERVVRIYDPFIRIGGGRAWTTLSYNTTYGLSQITEANKTSSGGRITVFAVNADSTLGSVQDPDSGRTLFTYQSGSRRLATVTDRHNTTTTFVYRGDSSWKLAAIQSPAVPIDIGGGVTRDSVLVTSLNAWQTLGVPTTRTSDSVRATPVNVLAAEASITDPAGHMTRLRVDRWGQPLNVTDPAGNVTQTVRNTDGLPTQITSPSNLSQQYSYSGPFLTSASQPEHPTMYFYYGLYGQLKQQLDGVGPVVDYFVNDAAMGRLDSTKVGGQYKTAYTYDTRGRLLSVVDPRNHTTRFTYDSVFGNRDSVQNPLGTGSKTLFDKYGRDSVLSVAGRGTTTTLYDQINRVRQQYDGLNANPTSIAYALDRPSRLVDSKGQIYKYSYNALGWPVTIYDPADTTRFVVLTYNADGLAASRTNREGKRLDLTYDMLHRLKTRTDPLFGSATFDYDAIGTRVVGQSRDSSGASIALDSAFLATSGWTDSVVTWLNGQRFRRQYRKDGHDRLDSLGLQTSAAIDFYPRRWYYNPTTGILDSIGVGASRVKFTYDTDGMRTGTDWLAGVTRTESWTAEHNPAGATFSTVAINGAFRRSFGYDAQGRINLESRLSNDASILQINRSYQFDALSELQRIQLDSVYLGTTFTTRKDGLYYDEVGNLRQQTDSLLGATVLAVTDVGNRLRSWNGVNYVYDKDGNVTSRSDAMGATNFKWDADGQLRWATRFGDTTYYDYDAAGQLVRRRKTGGVIDRWFLWDQGQILAELNNTALGRIAEYVYDQGIDQPVALITGPTGASVVHWYQQSGHGNVDGLIGATGALEQTLRYDEWGNLEAFSSSIADSTRLRWKGLYFDGGPAALYYVRARWYDPQARRFVSEDPIGLAGGINAYTFGGDDAVDMSDPSGLCPRSVQCLAGMVTIGHQPNVPIWPVGQSIDLSIYRIQENLAMMAERMRYSGRTGAEDTPVSGTLKQKAAQTLACFEDNKFSTLFAGSRFQAAAEFFEVGSEVSFGADLLAYGKKVRGMGFGGFGKGYASGMNRASRYVARDLVKSAGLQRTLIAIGDRVTVPTAIVGAFTTGYNFSIMAQCALGTLQ